MKNIVKILSVLTFCIFLGVCSHAASYTEALEVAYDVPVEAVLPNGRRLSVVDFRGDHLCIPGNVPLDGVSFVYTGDKVLYLPKEDKYIYPSESFTVELDLGEQRFYEYNESKDLFYYYKVNVMQGSDVSSFYIEFDDSYDFDVLDYLGRSKSNSAMGSLYVENGEGEVLYDGALDNIRCRGNSSFGSPGLQGDKRSFNIKLATKTELIEGAGEMKKWSLLHMRLDVEYDYDLTGLSTLLGLGTYDALCEEGYYTTKIECVDVYIEGEYRGAYLLVERLDVNAAVDVTDSDKLVEGEGGSYEWSETSSDPAIAKGVKKYRYSRGVSPMDGLDITGGYILEVGSVERCGFTTSRGISFDIKAPELCTKEQVQYIAAYVQGFEDALYSSTGYNDEGKHYTEYVDVKSMADSFLTYAFFQNWELMRTSTYLYKDVDGSSHDKLTFGPVWDFETGAQTLLTDTTLFGIHNFYNERRQYMWLEQLWSHADFMNAATESAMAISSYMHRMLDGEDAGIYQLLERQADSMSMNWNRWAIARLKNVTSKFPEVEPTYVAYAEYHLDAVRARLERWDEYWSEDYLLGAEIEEEYDEESGEYILTAVPKGTAEAYSWYRVTENGETEHLGNEGPTLSVSEHGTYYCAVEGPNNAFYRRASGSVFSYKSFTTRAFHTVGETQVADDAEKPVQRGIILWIFIGCVAFIAAVSAVTVIAKVRGKK